MEWVVSVVCHKLDVVDGTRTEEAGAHGRGVFADAAEGFDFEGGALELAYFEVAGGGLRRGGVETQ